MMFSVSIKNTHCFLIVLLLSTLIACAPSGRYQQKKDSVPSRIPTLLEQQNVIPRDEPKSRGGNKDYTVRGKSYTVLESAKAYKETGIASFYGEKFHGHLTSNGEIYNMFSMSAAHKSLPLPTYVKVTNLTNHRTAIVRVNDRGPFHPGRIIDLSYSAAYKLGISGVANVLVEAITIEDNSPVPLLNTVTSHNTVASSVITQPNSIRAEIPDDIIDKENEIKAIKTTKKQSFIQVFVTSKPETTQNIVTSLIQRYGHPVHIYQQNTLHHILMGPFAPNVDRIALLQQLKMSGYSGAFNKEVALP